MIADNGMEVMLKKCSKCKQEKSFECFTKDSRGLYGLRYHCKDCVKTTRDIYYAKNREVLISKGRKWRSDNIENHKKMIKNWANGNKGSRASSIEKSQITRSFRTPKWLSNMQIEEIANFYKKAVELKESTKEEYVVDHIVPIKGKNVSGLHVPWNLQVILRKENEKKGNRF